MTTQQRKQFEGREVVATEVVATGVAAPSDGRDPYHVGDVVYLVAEVVVDKVTHKPVKDTDRLVRVEQSKCVVAAVVDRGLVAEAIELAKINAEVADGVQRLGFESGE